MIHLVHLSEGERATSVSALQSTKTSNKFLNSLGKKIKAEKLLDENMFVACMERLHL